MKSSENLSCQGISTSRTDKRTFYILSYPSVVLLFFFFFLPDCSNNNVKIGLAGQVLRTLPVDTKTFLSGNVRCSTDKSSIYTCIDATLTAEVIAEEAERFGSTNII